MRGKGNCWNVNAVAESFFGSLKKERNQETDLQSRAGDR
jgi:transposase InsO family protein